MRYLVAEILMCHSQRPNEGQIRKWGQSDYQRGGVRENTFSGKMARSIDLAKRYSALVGCTELGEQKFVH